MRTTREALEGTCILIESTLAHVSHGGPTREQAEWILSKGREVLNSPAETVELRDAAIGLLRVIDEAKKFTMHGGDILGSLLALREAVNYSPDIPMHASYSQQRRLAVQKGQPVPTRLEMDAANRLALTEKVTPIPLACTKQEAFEMGARAMQREAVRIIEALFPSCDKENLSCHKLDIEAVNAIKVKLNKLASPVTTPDRTKPDPRDSI